ncbi:MAG: orotidine-5'-phosphate decarboxylase, partial [Firmicutes bacterium]|nr:orotidine-5'-phosphate decarboxylase [Bacillota bacterium]
MMLEKGTNMDREKAAEKIIAALDVDTEEEAYALVKQIYPPVSFFKVG